jgi:hypothetical protein
MIYLSYLYESKYARIELCVFNYRCIYPIYRNLCMFVWNYMCLIVNLLDLQLPILSWLYDHFLCVMVMQ